MRDHSERTVSEAVVSMASLVVSLSANVVHRGHDSLCGVWEAFDGFFSSGSACFCGLEAL